MNTTVKGIKLYANRKRLHISKENGQRIWNTQKHWKCHLAWSTAYVALKSKPRKKQIMPLELFSKNDETYARNASTIGQTSGVKNEETEWAERQT